MEITKEELLGMLLDVQDMAYTAAPPKKEEKPVQRLYLAVVRVFWLALAVLVIAVFYYIAAQQYRLPLPGNLLAAPQTTIEQQAPPPLQQPASAPQPRYTPFYGAPAPQPAPVQEQPAPALPIGSASGADWAAPAVENAPPPKAGPRRVKEKGMASDKAAPGEGSYSGGAWGEDE